MIRAALILLALVYAAPARAALLDFTFEQMFWYGSALPERASAPDHESLSMRQTSTHEAEISLELHFTALEPFVATLRWDAVVAPDPGDYTAFGWMRIAWVDPAAVLDVDYLPDPLFWRDQDQPDVPAPPTAGEFTFLAPAGDYFLYALYSSDLPAGGGRFAFDLTAQPVPEPSAPVMIGAVLASLCANGCRKIGTPQRRQR